MCRTAKSVRTTPRPITLMIPKNQKGLSGNIKSLQATRDGGSSSASRFTVFDPACLSWTLGCITAMKASIVCGVSLFAGLATGLYFDQRDEDRYVTKEAVALGLGAGQTLEGEGTAKAAGAAEATVGAD